MFKVKLDNELSKEKQKEEALVQKMEPVAEFKLLMDADHAEDVEIMRKLTSNPSLKFATKVQGRKLEMEAIAKEFPGALYTESQIEKMCIDYNLRFLKSTMYNRDIDVELTAKVKSFCRENNLDVMRTLDQNRFMIIAPAKMFALKEVSYKTAATIRKEDDPVLFYNTYKTVDGERIFAFVHKWGSDFTVLRYINAFKWRGYWSYMLYHTMCLAPIVMFLVAWVFPPSATLNFTFLISLLGFSVSALLAFICFGFKKQDEGKAIKNYFSTYCWDSEGCIKGKY